MALDRYPSDPLVAKLKLLWLSGFSPDEAAYLWGASERVIAGEFQRWNYESTLVKIGGFISAAFRKA